MTSITELDLAHVWHPYTQHGLSPHAVPIVRAQGALLYEAGGRPIIDAISSWWVTLHGHAHPVIAAAIAAQAERLEQVIFAGFTHEPAAAPAALAAESETTRGSPMGSRVSSTQTTDPTPSRSRSRSRCSTGPTVGSRAPASSHWSTRTTATRSER